MSTTSKAPRKRGRPSLSESESTLNNLYHVAFSHFIVNGIEGANLQLIAKEAGVSRQMIHNRFGSKEQFFETVAKYGESHLQGKFDVKIMTTFDDPWHLFNYLGSEIFSIFVSSENTTMFRVMNLAIYRHPEIGEFHSKSLNKAYSRFTKMLEQAADKLELPCKIDKNSARDFLALIYGYALPVIQGRAQRPSPKAQNAEVKRIVACFLRGLGFGEAPASQS